MASKCLRRPFFASYRVQIQNQRIVRYNVLGLKEVRPPLSCVTSAAGRRRRRYQKRNIQIPVERRLGMGDATEPLLLASTPATKGSKSPTKEVDPEAVTAEVCIAEDQIQWSSVLLPFLFPALGGTLFGYDIGITGGALVSLKDATLSGTDWYDLSSLATGLVVSGSLGGALLGSLLAFLVADPIGRRKELIASALCYLTGITTAALAPSLPVLVAGRVLYGIGIGLAMHAAPMYIAETAPARIRGTLISLKEAMIVLGILAGYLVGYLNIDTLGGWRYMIGLAAPAALLMGGGVWWLPPSPRWLLLRAVNDKGDVNELQEKAVKAMKRLRGVSVPQEVVEEQVEDMLAVIRKDKAESSADSDEFGALFRGTNLKALTIGAGLVFFQQVTGQPSVLYYAAPILQDAGFSAASDATRVSVIIGFFKLLMTGVAVVTVDKVGRRPLLLGGVSGLVAALVALAWFYIGGQEYPYVSVGALLLYVGAYQLSFGPISWLMVSEIFPLRVRGRALSLATLVNFASNAVVAFGFAPLEERLGQGGAFSLFAGIGLASLAFIYALVPETKGLSLEEVEELLETGKVK